MADMTRLRADAATIRAAAIAAVDPAALVARRLAVDGGRLVLDGTAVAPPIDLAAVERIVVVGAGKAAAGLAAGVIGVLGPQRLARHRVTGLVSVPAGCTADAGPVEVRVTRPAGENLPTPTVVTATREIRGLVAGLGPRDLAIAVITGGGSALLAEPRDGFTLADKIALTQRLSAAGADIATLNAARRALSAVKGGGLARSCAAGRLLVLVLSDVIGDDLEVIASGPCMPGSPTTPPGSWTTPRGCRVDHVLLGGNATAVDAAAHAARGLGYRVVVRHASPGSATQASATQASAETVGRRLAAVALAATGTGPLAIVEGGEATVTVPADHGTGGRNQQTVLAALDAVRRSGVAWPADVLLASVGTDGEDGPTTAAGAIAAADVAAAIAAAGLDVPLALARCDAHPLLAAAGGLVVTGPTGTNVADLRLVLVRA
jgi:hydroxypyruvate reductase